MDNKKITCKDIIKMISGIDKKLDHALSLYGKKYYPLINERNSNTTVKNHESI